MRIKEKFIKEKQLTDRPIPIFKTTQPLISRLESEYLFNQPLQNTHRNSQNKFTEKENFNMVNSKPIPNQYISHNVIQIDNYEDKKFKTQQGFEPMMTKSRFMGEQEQSFESSAVYKTSDNIVLRKEKARKPEERMYESVDQIQNERPLTFGLARKAEPMKSSVEYQEDIKMKNEILNELNLRKSQQSLLASKDFSASGFGDVARCINHNNKKAKYRLIADLEARDEEMIYCSKCAINLLQQGFKVEELKADVPLTCKLAKSQQNFVNYNTMMNSVGGSSTRLQEMRNFEQKLNETEIKVSEALQRSACETQNIEELERQSWQTQTIFDEMINHLKKEKQLKLDELNDKKNKKISSFNRNQQELKQELGSVSEMKKEMKEFRNKFIIMKENEFRFLINSFQNKIQNYGSYFEQTQIPSPKLEDKVNEIIIDLCEFTKNLNEDETQNEVNSSLTGTEKQRTNQDDEFICREIKGPFRTLFPEEESNPSGRKENEEDSPSFSKCHNDTFETMQRSLQNSQEFRF